MWRRCEVRPRFFEIAYQAMQTGARPPRLETFVAAQSGGATPQPGEIAHQGPVLAYASDGAILLPCPIPASTPAFDTLAFYNADGELMALARHPSPADSSEASTAFAYLDFPRG